MPSPADPGAGPRTGLERGARALALAALLLLLVRAIRDRPVAVHHSVRSAELAAALARWSSGAAPAAVHLESDGRWEPWQRDWLAALPGAGTAVTWGGAGPPAIALVAEPVPDPARTTRALVAAPDSMAVILEDAVGPLDSVRARAGGARFLLRSGPRRLRARAAEGSAAASLVTDSLRLGRLLLLGRAGWESKFVAAALEERGWAIDARLDITPRGEVRQGAASPLDTGRYAAVIVLDSGVVDPAALMSFVRSGGGAVLSMDAARTPGLAALAAGTGGTLAPGKEPFDSSLSEPRRSLALLPIREARDAVVLERRDSLTAVAARRIERGRALTSGYQDTWRWRMSGGGDAVEAHRDWWADLVAAVARSERIAVPVDGEADEAPLAALLGRLGSAQPRPAGPAGSGTLPDELLFGVLLGALLAEWASRRLRGAA